MKIELSELKEFLRYNIDDCCTDDFDRGMKNAFHVVWNNFCSMNYHPTSRACFDKPAGVPIEHWETVDGWVNTSVTLTENVDPVMWGFGFSDKKETL